MLVVLVAPGLDAQRLEPGQTVLDRPRPETDPKGVRVRSVMLYPSVRLAETVDSNIFATDDDPEADLITRLAPGLRVESDWPRHSLSLDVGAAKGVYAANPSENYLDWQTQLDGAVEIGENTEVNAGLVWAHEHEDRSSQEDVGGVEPTEFDRMGVDVSARHAIGPVSLGATVGVRRLDYDDVLAGDGRVINNDDRDRTVFQIGLRAGYAVSPALQVFLRTGYQRQDYDAAVDNTGFDRDGEGVSAEAGVAFEITGLTFGEAAIGVRRQTFADPRFDPVTGPSASLSVTSSITQLTTVQAGVSTSIDPTTGAGVSSKFTRQLDLSVDHELLRYVLLNAEAAIRNTDFQGDDRTDNDLRLGLGATYLVSRYFKASLDYDYQARFRDGGGQGFDRHRVTLSGTLRY